VARPRKPTTILELVGRLKHDPATRRARANEPTDNGPLGDAPARLNASQREVWDELKGTLVEGVALVSDASAFEGLVWLEEKRRRNDITGPELSLWKQLHSLFGKTPADRSRVSVPKAGPKANPFGKLGGKVG
jgi:hypothetical protein